MISFTQGFKLDIFSIMLNLNLGIIVLILYTAITDASTTFNLPKIIERPIYIYLGSLTTVPLTLSRFEDLPNIFLKMDPFEIRSLQKIYFTLGQDITEALKLRRFHYIVRKEMLSYIQVFIATLLKVHRILDRNGEFLLFLKIKEKAVIVSGALKHKKFLEIKQIIDSFMMDFNMTDVFFGRLYRLKPTVYENNIHNAQNQIIDKLSKIRMYINKRKFHETEFFMHFFTITQEFCTLTIDELFIKLIKYVLKRNSNDHLAFGTLRVKSAQIFFLHSIEKMSPVVIDLGGTVKTFGSCTKSQMGRNTEDLKMITFNFIEENLIKLNIGFGG